MKKLVIMTILASIFAFAGCANNPGSGELRKSPCACEYGKSYRMMKPNAIAIGES